MKTLTKIVLLPYTNENCEKRFLLVIINENRDKIKKNIKKYFIYNFVGMADI
jgi:hypothetical protein